MFTSLNVYGFHCFRGGRGYIGQTAEAFRPVILRKIVRVGFGQEWPAEYYGASCRLAAGYSGITQVYIRYNSGICQP